MKKVLLLNTDWTPLNFVSEIRAINLLMKGRCEVIIVSEKPSVWNEKIPTPTREYDSPATLRVLDRVNRNGEIGVWTTTPHKSTGGEGACEREGPPLRPFFPHQF